MMKPFSDKPPVNQLIRIFLNGQPNSVKIGVFHAEDNTLFVVTEDSHSYFIPISPEDKWDYLAPDFPSKHLPPPPDFSLDESSTIEGIFLGTTKPSNPKDTIGSSKLPFSCVPLAVWCEVAAGMGEGAIKYGKHNWRTVGVRASIYFDATLRHLIGWYEGEDVDPDSGLSHVTKAITSLCVLRDAMIQNNWVDDRPPASKNNCVREGNEAFKHSLSTYEDCGLHYDRESLRQRGTYDEFDLGPTDFEYDELDDSRGYDDFGL